MALEPFFRNHVNYSAMLVCVLPILAAYRSAVTSIQEKENSHSNHSDHIVAGIISFLCKRSMAGIIYWNSQRMDDPEKETGCAYIMVIVLVLAAFVLDKIR